MNKKNYKRKGESFTERGLQRFAGGTPQIFMSPNRQMLYYSESVKSHLQETVSTKGAHRTRNEFCLYCLG